MRNIYLIIITLVLLIPIKAFCQNDVFGKYVSMKQPNNYETYEEILLNNDSTFQYYQKLGLITFKLEGNWILRQDTLVLNSKNNAQDKIIVEESNIKMPRNKYQFNVAFFDTRQPSYNVYLKNKKGVIKTIKYLEGKNLIKSSRLHSFKISSTLEYPEYIIKNKTSNSFYIRLNPQKIFNDEKWILKDGKIWTNSSGEIKDYYLSK